MQNTKEPTADAQQRLSYKDAAMRAAKRTPPVVMPVAVEAYPQLSQRNTGRKSADQQAEVRVTPSCVLMKSKHQSVHETS